MNRSYLQAAFPVDHFIDEPCNLLCDEGFTASIWIKQSKEDHWKRVCRHVTNAKEGKAFFDTYTKGIFLNPTIEVMK